LNLPIVPIRWLYQAIISFQLLQEKVITAEIYYKGYSGKSGLYRHRRIGFNVIKPPDLNLLPMIVAGNTALHTAGKIDPNTRGVFIGASFTRRDTAILTLPNKARIHYRHSQLTYYLPTIKPVVKFTHIHKSYSNAVLKIISDTLLCSVNVSSISRLRPLLLWVLLEFAGCNGQDAGTIVSQSRSGNFLT